MAKIDGKTKVYGLFGYPVTHSFSPAMQNAAFEKLGLNAVYLPFAVRPDRIKEALAGVRSMEWAGVNLTIPHKEICLPFLDELSPEAKLIGAVNTIISNNGQLIGSNTDGRGFVSALRRELRVEPKGRSILIFGAGGAGRAVAMQLAIEGAKAITIVDAADDRSRRLAIYLRKHSSHCRVECLPHFETSDIERSVADTDILVNATPVGMKESDPILISPKALHCKLAVCDLVYNPPVTKLLKVCQKKRIKCMNGLGMLLYQGVLAFHLWTGLKPPIEVMRKALLKEIRKSR